MQGSLRGIRVLLVGGTLLLAFGLFFLDFSAAFICFDSCPPESDLAASIADRVTGAIPIALICAAPVALAWVLCLVYFGQARRWGALVVLALALPLSTALSLSAWYVGTDGHLFPTTWAEHNAGWDGTFERSLLLLLLWPVATFVATFLLRHHHT